MSYRKERNGALYFHLLKSALVWDFVQASRLVTLLNDQQEDRNHGEGAGRNFQCLASFKSEPQTDDSRRQRQ